MDALISGTLGTATLISGDAAEVIWLDGKRQKMPLSAAESIHRNIIDVIRVSDCSKNQALEALRLHWMKDRALTLLLIYLDVSTPSDERQDIRQTLDDWLDHDSVSNYLKFTMYSKPLPKGTYFVPTVADKHTKTTQLISDLLDAQSTIRFIRETWNDVARHLDSSQTLTYEQGLIAVGAFFRLCALDRKEIDSVRFDCVSHFKDLPQSREVISSFLSPLLDVSEGDSESVLDNVESTEAAILEPLPASLGRGKTALEQLQHVRKRLSLAESHFASGEMEKAEQVISWLAKEQIERGETSFAAKTLCSASELAKQVGNFDLQLTLVTWAYEIAPEDLRTCAHVGDAYLNLGDYSQAEEWFWRAAVGEQREFALGGLVRTYRRSNRLQEAYDLVLTSLNETPGSLDTWHQKAEILRDLGRYDEAISSYSEAIENFPNSCRLICGLAASNSDAGYYEAALRTYEIAISQFPADGVAYTGKGHLLARLGQFREALPLLQLGIDLAEDKTVPVNALASALRMHGKNMRAIQLLKSCLETELTSEPTWMSLIDCATQMGRYSDALSYVDEAVSVIGKTDGITLQEAKIHAASGDCQRALVELEKLIAKSPNLVEAHVERSQVLRRLEQTSIAIQSMQPLLENFGQFVDVKREATLLGVLSVVEDAVLNRAGVKKLATLEDWKYDHACSIALVSRNDAKSAWRITLDGKKRSPFKALKRKFAIVLAVARDLLGRVGSVVNGLRGYSGPEAVVMRVLVYWKLGLNDRLKHSLTVLRSRQHELSDLVDHIYDLVLSPYDERKDWERIFEIERRLLLRSA